MPKQTKFDSFVHWLIVLTCLFISAQPIILALRGF